MHDPIAQFMAGNSQIVGAGPQIVGGQSVQNDDSYKLFRMAAGIPSQSLAAGASVDLLTAVTEAFRPDRLILSVAAQALNLTGFKIGSKSLIANSSPISGNCFSQDAVGSFLMGYTAQPGTGFTVSLNNPTIAAVITGGGVFGPALM